MKWTKANKCVMLWLAEIVIGNKYNMVLRISKMFVT